MKTITNIFLGLGLLLIAFGCSPEEPRPIDEPSNRLQQISGTWEVVKVLQVDVPAEQKGFPTIARVRDITNALPGMSYTDATFTFTSSGNTPASFNIEKGDAPLLLPVSGNWKFDNPNYPAAVVLTADGNDQMLEIASFAEIESGVLVLKTIRDTPEGRPYVRYEYYLNRVSQ